MRPGRCLNVDIAVLIDDVRLFYNAQSLTRPRPVADRRYGNLHASTGASFNRPRRLCHGGAAGHNPPGLHIANRHPGTIRKGFCIETFPLTIANPPKIVSCFQLIFGSAPICN